MGIPIRVSAEGWEGLAHYSPGELGYRGHVLNCPQNVTIEFLALARKDLAAEMLASTAELNRVRREAWSEFPIEPVKAV